MASEREADRYPARSYEDWREAAEATLKGAPFDKKLVSRTHEGVAVQPVYGPSGPPRDAAGMPGLAPFTRGGAAGAGWELQQHYAYPEPATNARAMGVDLARGVQAVWLRLDEVCRAGGDHDASEHLSAAGRGGAITASLDDLRACLGSVDLATTGVTIDAGACGLPAAALLLAHARLPPCGAPWRSTPWPRWPPMACCLAASTPPTSSSPIWRPGAAPRPPGCARST